MSDNCKWNAATPMTKAAFRRAMVPLSKWRATTFTECRTHPGVWYERPMVDGGRRVVDKVRTNDIRFLTNDEGRCSYLTLSGSHVTVRELDGVWFSRCGVDGTVVRYTPEEK